MRREDIEEIEEMGVEEADRDGYFALLAYQLAFAASE